jgi:hypothetical protein
MSAFLPIGEVSIATIACTQPLLAVDLTRNVSNSTCQVIADAAL